MAEYLITKLYTINFFCMVMLLMLSFQNNIMVNAQEGPIQFVKRIVQDNLVGAPVVHKTTLWDFDPDVGVKRRPQFYEVHGYRGEKLIERLGLGIDGNAEQRLLMQRARDEGRLNGVIYQKEYDATLRPPIYGNE